VGGYAKGAGCRPAPQPPDVARQCRRRGMPGSRPRGGPP